MPRIGRFLDLELFELPDFTTVCMRMQGLKMPIWRRLLRLSAGAHDTGGSRRSTQPAWIAARRALRQTNELHVQSGENDCFDRL